MSRKGENTPKDLLGPIAACLLLAAAFVLWADWGALGAVSLLKIVELGLFALLTLTWCVGSWGRWRALRQERATSPDPEATMDAPAAGLDLSVELALGLRALLPAALLLGAFLGLARLLLGQPGFDPRSSLVALGMVMLLGLGRWLHRGSSDAD